MLESREQRYIEAINISENALFASICALFSSCIGEGHNWVSIYWTRMQFEREKCDNSSDDAKIILRIFVVVVVCLRPGLEFLLRWHGQFSVCVDFYSSLLGEAHNLRCFHWAKSDGGSWGLWVDPAMVILWRWLFVCVHDLVWNFDSSGVSENVPFFPPSHQFTLPRMWQNLWSLELQWTEIPFKFKCAKKVMMISSISVILSSTGQKFHLKPNA